jgi:hypothetical protein
MTLTLCTVSHISRSIFGNSDVPVFVEEHRKQEEFMHPACSVVCISQHPASLPLFPGSWSSKKLSVLVIAVIPLCCNVLCAYAPKQAANATGTVSQPRIRMALAGVSPTGCFNAGNATLAPELYNIGLWQTPSSRVLHAAMRLLVPPYDFACHPKSFSAVRVRRSSICALLQATTTHRGLQICWWSLQH